MRATTNLELRESNADGSEGSGLSHSAAGLFLLHVVEVAEEGEPRGGVTVIHDAGDHGGRYGAFADFLAADAWAVSLPDLRGHGESEGERGHCNGLSEVVRDLDSIQDHLTIFAPSIPLAFVGQGLGGLYALAYLIENPGRVRAAVVLSPTLSPDFRLPEKKGGLAGMFQKVKPTSPGSIGYSPAALTGLAAEQAAWSADGKVHDAITVRAGEVVRGAADTVRRRVSEISVPVLVLHGADDTLANPADSRALAGGSVEVRILEGRKHDLLHDAGATELQVEIREWLEANVST
jgi:lysophospholipase